MIAGYIQNAPVFGDRKANFAAVTKLAKGLKADILVLPELFATGYAFSSREEALSQAEPAEGPTSAFLKELSDSTGAVISAGFIESEGDRIYNAAMLVFDGRVIGTYRKIHLFNRENLWFSPGDKPLEVHDVKGMRIGMMICFDWMFPEVARTLALRGAQIIAHPSNLVMPWCQSAMVTRCLENRVFAITANRVGRETRGGDDFTFTGKSQVTCVNGNILASAPMSSECSDLIEIDTHHSDNKSINPFNNLISGRRPEFYG